MTRLLTRELLIITGRVAPMGVIGDRTRPQLHGCSCKVRLDVFLKRTGLLKQRALAKEECDRGRVRVDGREAKAGKEIGQGMVIRLETTRGVLEIEVASLPQRNYKRKEGEAFYKIRSQVPDEIF